MSGQSEKRSYPRAEIVRLSHISIGNNSHACTLTNISASGAKFEFSSREQHPFIPRDMVAVSITETGDLSGELSGELRGKILRTTPSEVAVSFLLSKPDEKQLVATIQAALG